MRGRTAALAAALVLTALWGGLPRGRELGDMVLVRTIAVDRAEEDWVVTASTVRRTRGLPEEGQTSLTLSARGSHLAEALEGLERLADREVFFGYADQLLLGESAARAGVLPILEYFAADRELGVGAQVWLIRGRAQDVLTGGGEEREQTALTLPEDEDSGEDVPPCSVGEVLTRMLEEGQARVPALEERAGALLGTGYGVLDAGGLRERTKETAGK